MSAIFGILRFDGAPVSPRDLERMGNTLAHRGPDGRKFVADGPVGLGHCLMRVNHEDLFERQPLRDREADLTLVADCRIDNRDELAEAFAIDAAALRDMPDSALVLRAYKQWGEECAEHLIGDFAFAVWDERGKKLFLARDHMGQRYVFHHHGKDFFAFATEIKGLWAVAEVPRALSEMGLGRALILDQNIKPGATAFEGVAGLPGGTAMTVTAAGADKSRRFWEPRADPAHVDRDEAYYVEAYRRVLDEAVACRLRRAIRPAGLLFSGGFDSSAVAGLAGPWVSGKGQKLITVTSVGPAADGTWAPHPWVELCRRHMPHLDVRYAAREGRSIFAGMERAFLADDGPHSVNRYINDEMYGVLAAAGARIVMNGLGGDYTLNPRGQKALARFLATGQWRRFMAEFGPWRRHQQRSILETVKQDLLYVLLLRSPVSAWRRYRAGLRPFGPRRPIAPALARKMIAAGAAPKREFGSPAALSMRALIAQALRRQQSGAALAGSVMAAAHGLTLTQPFHDKRVVELGLAVPEDLYVKGGRPRHLARLAFADLYPPEFQDRSPRNDPPEPDFTRMVERERSQVLAEVGRMEREGRLTQFFDFPRLRRMLGEGQHPGSAKRFANLEALTAFLRARYIEWFQRENR